MAWLNLVKQQPQKTDPVVAYAQPQQETPKKPGPEACDCPECQKIINVLENQRTIVQNQQVILDSIHSLAKLITDAAQAAEEPAADPEPTPEELRAAWEAQQAAKKTEAPRIGRPPKAGKK